MDRWTSTHKATAWAKLDTVACANMAPIFCFTGLRLPVANAAALSACCREQGKKQWVSLRQVPQNVDCP